MRRVGCSFRDLIQSEPINAKFLFRQPSPEEGIEQAAQRSLNMMLDFHPCSRTTDKNWQANIYRNYLVMISAAILANMVLGSMTGLSVTFVKIFRTFSVYPMQSSTTMSHRS